MTRENLDVASIILAAGKGTRMKSQKPKVLHPVCGSPLIVHVIRSLSKSHVHRHCLVLGGDLDAFDPILKAYPEITTAVQENRLGTGDAVAAAACAFPKAPRPPFAKGHIHRGDSIDSDYVIITAGDTPALNPDILQDFMKHCLKAKASLAVLGMRHPQPFGYGRLIVENGELERIVEEKDADDKTKAINLCNSGVIFAKTEFLFSCLENISDDNAQKEYYLTDCFAVARERGQPALVYETQQYRSFDGVNTRLQLATIEQWMVQEIKKQHMAAGVSFNLVESCYVDDTVKIGSDTIIGANCSLLGETYIGKNCQIGANSVLSDCYIPDGARIKAGSTIENQDLR